MSDTDYHYKAGNFNIPENCYVISRGAYKFFAKWRDAVFLGQEHKDYAYACYYEPTGKRMTELAASPAAARKDLQNLDPGYAKRCKIYRVMILQDEPKDTLTPEEGAQS